MKESRADAHSFHKNERALPFYVITGPETLKGGITEDLKLGSAALFEEPTYLDCVNVLFSERFQYPDRLFVRLHARAEPDAAGQCAQASAGRLHTGQSGAHRAEILQCGNNGVH